MRVLLNTGFGSLPAPNIENRNPASTLSCKLTRAVAKPGITAARTLEV